MEEAKYSANVRANLRGYDVQITARSDGEDDLLTILVAMVEELDRIGATPERRWENGKPNGNGNGHKEPQAQAIAAPQPSVPAPAPAPKPGPKPPQPKAQAKAPACQQCGSDAQVELIRWNDRETGEPKQAHKCQTCGVWIRN